MGRGAASEGYHYHTIAHVGAETYPAYAQLGLAFMRKAPMLAETQSCALYLYSPFMGIVGTKAMNTASGGLATGP